MATPEQVRAGLTVVTAAAVADTRAVAAVGQTPGDIRAALFAAAPLIVGDYSDGSSALALDWYEELRDAANPRRSFTPRSLAVVREDELASSVAWATEALYDLERDLDRLTEELLREATERSLTLLEPVIQKDVAAGFRDTVTGNVQVDPDAVGWQRFARPGACKFCVMLADKGAVYTEATADFAAHTTCHCVCGPSFDLDAPQASVMQYVASSKNRTPAQRKALRDYLNQNYPDAPG
jgi:hypothetical protein